MSKTSEIEYVASKTARSFHKSDAFVRALIGPIGSGKSVACVIEIFKKAVEQKAHNGVRKSRWVVVRNTYRELLDTTMETFFDWIPKELGHYSVLNSKFTLNIKLNDGTKLYSEILFRALDKPNDIKKLLSLEVTGMWINEAREIPKQVLDMGIGRCGRYPSKREGGPSWYGVIMDTNPCDTDHWWYKIFEENLPHNYAIFHQPSGDSAQAENTDNLPDKYYTNMQAGKDKEWVKVYVRGEYGYIANGQPVYPEFIADIHILEKDGVFDPTLDLWVGLDFGRTPAAAFAQLQDDVWVFLDEITTENTGAVKFAQILGKKLRKSFRGSPETFIFGDPSGDFGGQANDDTPFSVLQDAGIDAYPAPSQNPTVRRESMARQMTMLSDYGKPRLAISPKCKMLIKGLSGGFKYKRVQVPGEERYQSKPDKGKFSHVCEAAEYLLVGAGEDVTIVGGSENQTIDYSKLNTAA